MTEKETGDYLPDPKCPCFEKDSPLRSLRRAQMYLAASESADALNEYALEIVLCDKARRKFFVAVAAALVSKLIPPKPKGSVGKDGGPVDKEVARRHAYNINVLTEEFADELKEAIEMMSKGLIEFAPEEKK